MAANILFTAACTSPTLSGLILACAMFTVICTASSCRRTSRHKDKAAATSVTPAAVGGQLDVVCQQRFEPRQVAVLGCGEEPPGELVTLLACCLETRPALLD